MSKQIHWWDEPVIPEDQLSPESQDFLAALRKGGPDIREHYLEWREEPEPGYYYGDLYHNTQRQFIGEALENWTPASLQELWTSNPVPVGYLTNLSLQVKRAYGAGE